MAVLLRRFAESPRFDNDTTPQRLWYQHLLLSCRDGHWLGAYSYERSQYSGNDDLMTYHYLGGPECLDLHQTDVPPALQDDAQSDLAYYGTCDPNHRCSSLRRRHYLISCCHGLAESPWPRRIFSINTTNPDFGTRGKEYVQAQIFHERSSFNS